MVMNMARQLPKITYCTFADHFKVRKIVKEYDIDMIISDNRFGCFHFGKPSYFITHQLNLDIPNPIARFLGNAANRFWIARYQECWIPDFKHRPNISGKLSHPSPLKKVKYIGALSRMKKMEISKKYDCCIILSGPEPQRTYLEEKLIEQAKKIKGNIILIKGKTEKNEIIESDNLTIYSYMNSEELNKTICASEFVVSRSGYSTLMDLSVLGTKALLIPTPGQTEQEYLARHFHEQEIFMMQQQHEIDLEKARDEIKNFKGMHIEHPDNSLALFFENPIQ